MGFGPSNLAERQLPESGPPDWPRRREHAQELIAAALGAVDPARAVARNLTLERDGLRVGDRGYPLREDSRVFLVGGGKAGVAMARAAVGILGDRLHRAVMAVPDQPSDGGQVDWIEAGHPLPTEGSVAAGRRFREMLAAAREQDLVLALISGGGSALMELPVQGVNLADLRATTELLLRSGATIHEINAVRHQLSQIKGGGLAQMAAPAPVATLLLSDVVGDQLEIIASGPTVPARSTRGQARRIVERYSLASELPEPVLRHLSSTAGTGSGPQPTAHHLIVANNRMAAQATAERAVELGFGCEILTTFLEGEAREVGRVAAALAKSVRAHGQPLAPPACLLLGGETTVRVIGSGRGGRNQELCLAAAISLAGWERCLLASFGTDGIDGPTPAAGGIVTGETAAEAAAAKVDLATHLDDNNSHEALSALAATIQLGPTGTNVNDLTFILVY